MSRIPMRWIWGLIVGLVCACADRQNSGTSTETENSVAFRILFPGNKVAPGAHYRVRPAWFVADHGDSGVVAEGVADAHGWIYLGPLDSGAYAIEVRLDSLGALLFYETGNSVIARALTLGRLGCVSGSVGLISGEKSARVRIYGLAVGADTDSSGNFSLCDLPPGEIRLVVLSERGTETLGLQTVVLGAGERVVVGLLSAPQEGDENPQSWRYESSFPARALISDWMRPLSFPAVLTLRLKGDAFDFEQASAEGSDIRIIARDGHFLTIRRVYWDPSNRRGVLKIRVERASDTVGNWRFLWGNPLAVSFSSADIWNGISDSLRLAWNSVLVDDFEDGDALNAIGKFTWYPGRSNGAVISPATADSVASAIYPAGSGGSGLALRVRYSGDYPEWVLIGTTLSKTPVSLAHLDSVVFWQRGNGTSGLALEYLDSATVIKALFTSSVNNTWTRVRVRPADFMSPDSIGGNYGWGAVKHRVTHLTFFINNGSEFWLDAVRFYGINRDDLEF